MADAELRLFGIFTDGDLRRTLQQCGEQGRDVMALRVDEVMSKDPKTCRSCEMAVDAMQVMRGWVERPGQGRENLERRLLPG